MIGIVIWVVILGMIGDMAVCSVFHVIMVWGVIMVLDVIVV